MLDESLFVSDAVHERPIELPDGKKHVLHFKELPATAFRAYHLAEKSEDAEVRATAVARLIAASLCNPDGSPAMTFERACKLKPAPASAMLQAVLNVNGFGAAAKNG